MSASCRMLDLARQLGCSLDEVRDTVNELTVRHGVENVVVHEDNPPYEELLGQFWRNLLLTETAVIEATQRLGGMG